MFRLLRDCPVPSMACSGCRKLCAQVKSYRQQGVRAGKDFSSGPGQTGRKGQGKGRYLEVGQGHCFQNANPCLPCLPQCLPCLPLLACGLPALVCACVFASFFAAWAWAVWPGLSRLGWWSLLPSARVESNVGPRQVYSAEGKREPGEEGRHAPQALQRETRGRHNLRPRHDDDGNGILSYRPPCQQRLP